MDKENGDGGIGDKYKGSGGGQSGGGMPDPNSLLDAASLFGKNFYLYSAIFNLCNRSRIHVLKHPLFKIIPNKIESRF